MKCLLCVLVGLTVSGWTLAADEPRVPDERPDPSGDVAESILPYEPKVERSPEAAKKIEATAHYMNGLVLQKRGDFNGAMNEFRKALAADPTGVEIYRSLIVLALRFNDRSAAEQLLLEALKHAPNDLQMLRLLGAIYEDRREIPRAIEVLEKASQSPQLERDSQDYAIVMIELGLLYRSTGNKEKAADAYEVILKVVRNPEQFNLTTGPAAQLLENPELSFERIGSVFLEAGRFEQALAAFELAERDPKIKVEEIGYFKARIFTEQKKFDEALPLLQAYFDKKLQSQGLEPYKLFATVLTGLGREAEIDAELQKLIDADASNNFILYALADRYVAAGDLNAAESHYQKAIARGADPDGYRGLMGLYYRQKRAGDWLGALSGLLSLGKNAEGVDDHFKAISGDTEFLDAVNAEGRRMKESGSQKFNFPEAYILGRLNAAAKSTAGVIEFYRMAMTYRRNQQPELSLELAQYLLEQEEYAEVEKLMEEALTLRASAPVRARFGQNLAQALIQLSLDLEEAGETKQALAKVNRANEVFADNVIVLYRLGWLQYRSDETQTAITTFESLISQFENSNVEQIEEIVKRTHFILSSVYVQEGQLRKGEELLEKIYEQDPEDPSVNNDLGYLYADHNKNLEQAEKMIRKAVAAEPENEAYQDSLAWVLYRLGKLDEALKHMLVAVKDSKEGDATLWDHLGDIYDKMGNRDKAVEAWTTGLKQAEADKLRDDKIINSLREKLGMPPTEAPLKAPIPGK